MSPVNAFIRRGTNVAYFLPAVAGASPTRPEIAAGIPLGDGITAWTGFQTSRSNVAVPRMSKLDTEQIPGERTLGDASITFIAPKTGADTYRLAMAEGTVGYVVKCPRGDIPGDRCEVWPIEVKDINDDEDLGNTFAKFVVAVSITGAPNKNATIPAA